MNELDKRLYKALKFFADNTRAKVTTIIEENKEEYEENVPEDMNIYLSEMDYISADAITRYAITEDGLKELRTLEQIKHRDKVVYVSITALIISIYTLAKTQGWI